MTAAAPFVLPTPFVSALLAGLIALRLMAGADGSRASRILFAALFALFAAQATLVGLRFGFGVDALAPLQAVLPLGVGPVLWAGFRVLEAPRAGWATAAHPGAALALAGAALLAPALMGWIDLLIAASYAVYLALLVGVLRRGPDDLARAGVEHVAPLRLWLGRAVALLAFLFILDGAIAVDFAVNDGRTAATIIGAGNLALIAAAAALALAPASRTSADPPATGRAAPSAEDRALAARAASLLDATGLHRDPTLTLARLARRLGVPARALSGAINRTHGENVSQFVNGRRVAEAAARLAEPGADAAEAMAASGFISRSNFHREFRRVHGVSPAEYRRRVAGG